MTISIKLENVKTHNYADYAEKCEFFSVKENNKKVGVIRKYSSQGEKSFFDIFLGNSKRVYAIDRVIQRHYNMKDAIKQLVNI